MIANGHDVIGIDNLSGGYKAFVAKGDNFKFVKLNLERRKKVEELFEEHNPDVLYHFAERMLLKVCHLSFVILIIEIIFYVLPT